MFKLRIVAMTVLSLFTTGIAQADTWDLQYSGLGVTFAGSFTTAGDGMSGFEPILSFEGIRNGVIVSGLTSTTEIGFQNTFNNNPAISKYLTLAGPVYGLAGAPSGTFVNVYAASGLGYREYFSSGGLTTDSDIHLTITAAVPEPETYAMLITGLAIIGIATRRKQKKLVNSKLSFS